nr:10747_t:CDS:2 [Entrophospora candida]
MNEVKGAVELQNFTEPPKIYIDDTTTEGDIQKIELNENELLYRNGFKNSKETLKPVEVNANGNLPSWLNGDFYTVGPGTYDIKYNKMIQTEGGGYESGTATFSIGHWFDGLPLVNRFDIDGENNKVTYRSKLTSRKFESKIRDRHGIITRHPFSLFKTNLLGQKRTDKPEMEPCCANINLNFPFNKPGEKPKIFCQNHASQVVELDANDLIPERVYSWDEINANFKGDHAAPHSYYDEQTGELINFNMEYHALGTKYNFFSITSSNPNGELIGTVFAKPSYIHSFSVTQRFIILVIYPLYGTSSTYNFKWSDNILDYFAFNPEEPTLFHLISRTKKQHILTYKSDACFAFHHINAFEDDEDNIFVDMSCYDNADIAHYLTIENLSGGLVRGLPLSEVRRFALQNIQIESVKFAKNPQSSSFEVIQNTVSAFLWSTNSNQQVYYPWPVANYVRCADSTLELPTINPKYKGNRYRYVYGIGLSAKAAGQEGQIWDSIVKSDLDTKEVVAMWGTENCYPSEPIFVPEPGEDHEEDDGVLLSVIFDGLKISSFLIILEAKTLTELARVNLPQVIPLSFGHGAFKAKEN